MAYNRSLCTNARNIDTKTPFSDIHLPSYVVSGQSSNMPNECYAAFREVRWIHGGCIQVVLYGTENNSGDTWVDTYNGVTWVGWKKITGDSNANGAYVYIQNEGGRYIRYIIKNKTCEVQMYTLPAGLSNTTFVRLFDLPKPKASFLTCCTNDVGQNIILNISATGLVEGKGTVGGNQVLLGTFAYTIL